MGSGDVFAEFWSVTGWLVGNSWFVTTLVDINALVVAQVFSARSLELQAQSPPGGITSLSVTSNISVRVSFLTGSWVAGNLVSFADGFVDIFLLTSGVGFERGSSGNHWVLLQEASVQARVLISQTFDEPFNNGNIQTGVIATSGGFALSLSDQVVDVACWVLSGIQKSGLVGGGETFLSWNVHVLFVAPSRAPFLFSQSGRVFLEAPWVFPVGGWFVAAVDVG